MKLKILDVKKGSHTGGPNGTINWDFDVTARTENGLEIEIFDLNGFNLRKYKNKYVDCLILAIAGEIEDIPKFMITGKYIKDYKIPSKWKRCSHSSYKKSAVKTDYGIFLVESNDLRFKGKDGKRVEFNGHRLDLFDYVPID